MHVRALTLLLLSSGLAGCSPATGGNPPSTGSILFVGNSLTYTNDLPSLVAQVARAAQDSVEVGMAAGGNLAVIDHTNGATDAVARIDGGDWAFVVLQQGPTPAGICRDTLIIAAMRLAPHVQTTGGRIALFLPWARQGSPGLLAPAAESGTLAARAVGGVAVPVGLAWKLALEADPTLPLYAPDGYHPAPAGSLLAALTIYDRVFGRDVREIPAATLSAASLTAGRVQILLTAAHAASASLPPDPTQPVPADTSRISPFGGPC
jgi:hypothetical protein